MPFTFEKCLQLTNAARLNHEDAEDLEAALTSGGGIGGSGTAQKIPKFTDEVTLADSIAREDSAGFDGIVIEGRLWVDRDIGVNPVQDGVIYCITRGTDLGAPPVLDGGIQSFHLASYNCSVARQSFAGAFTNTSSRASGSETLKSTALWANAPASSGVDNVSFHGENGRMFNRDAVFFADSLTVGDAGTLAAANETKLWTSFTIGDPAARVNLGENVASFRMLPNPSTGGISLNVGYSSGSLAQIATKNTDTGGSFGGLEVHLDTTVSASARGGVQLYRGAGGTTEVGGLNVAGGNDHFAVGAVANDIVLHAYAGSGRVCIATGSNPDVRTRWLSTGSMEVLAGMKVTGDIGFYGTAPIAQQTGVAVSAAGIHAALVNLGLITG